MGRRLSRSAPWVLVAILPGALILANELRKGGRERVDVVGAGPVALLQEADAPRGARFYLDTVPEEEPRRTLERITAVYRAPPPILVFGFDASSLRKGVASVQELRTAMESAARGAETLTVASVFVGVLPPAELDEGSARETTALRNWWREELCRTARRVICVEIEEWAESPTEIRAAVVETIRSAQARLRSYRAASQVGR